MRRHIDPKRKTTQDQKTPATPTAATTATSTGALHLIRGTAPVTWRCTRYVALHPLRGGAPEQKGCNAYSSGALPQRTRKNAELAHRTTHRRTPPCITGPTGGRMGTPPTLPPALRPTPTPPTPLHAKSRLTPPAAPRRNGSEPIARQAGQPAGFSETSARTRLGPSAVARMPRYWGRHAKQPMVRWSCAGVRLRHVMSMSVGVGLAVVMT